MKLQAGQTAIVTGAASGIGRALSEAFAERGLRVVMADVDGAGVEAAAAQIAGALGMRCDVTDAADVDQLRDVTLERLGRIDMVCNNAGVALPFKPVWEHPASDVEWMMDINIRGVLNGIRTFMPLLVEQRHGHLLNTASMAGVTTIAFNGPFNASKHAVVAITETIALELETLDIPVGVSVLCPGRVQTNNRRTMQRRPAATSNEAEAHTVPAEAAKQPIAAAEAAAITLDGIEADRLHIFTDPNARDRVRVRIDRLLADLED